MKEYEVAIIGGGPAGLTAGLYASRYGLKTILLERGLFGGQIVNASEVHNYPGFPNGVSGMDLGQLMYDQAAKFGLQAETAEVTGIKSSGAGFDITVDDETVSAKAVIIATGSNYRKMGVDGEARLSGRGVSYCATCDGFLFKNKEEIYEPEERTHHQERRTSRRQPEHHDRRTTRPVPPCQAMYVGAFDGSPSTARTT
jgi:thioredoxin reductase (NADPH)